MFLYYQFFKRNEETIRGIELDLENQRRKCNKQQGKIEVMKEEFKAKELEIEKVKMELENLKQTNSSKPEAKQQPATKKEESKSFVQKMTGGSGTQNQYNNCNIQSIQSLI